ncbi:hypothetical protein MKK75_11410 [Methylobacterium sp. J-030]|uniref:hypothetical protein n=1 Tax=Methylobacterium sp. J-030 TaxID=2836627 RepID=UPI001FBB34F7|nr:hypothetical protein [Methylobacterium sp. J-030]MCJ2069391.1 hypothetical protein [Methylobacterium sp. J-030]
MTPTMMQSPVAPWTPSPPTEEAERERAVRFDNPYLPLPPADGMASCRAALAGLIEAIDAAQAGERLVVDRISIGVREKGEADARHAVARTAVISAREASAADMKAWFEGGCQGERPDGAATLSGAMAAEAEALAAVEVITAALDAMHLDHEAARLLTVQAQHAAGLARDRIVAEHASALAADLVAADERAAGLRRVLRGFYRSAQGGPNRIPASVEAALPVKRDFDTHVLPAAQAQEALWRDARAALMRDPQTELPRVD